MAKEPIAKVFDRPRVGARRYSRSPNDTTPPNAPVVGIPVAPSSDKVTVTWTYGVDAQTGISVALVELRPATDTPWTSGGTQVIVSYPTATYTFEGLIGGTGYDVRVANRDGATPSNTSAYSEIKTIITSPTAAQLAPGNIAITSSALSVTEGASFSVTVTRSGAGLLAPTVEADYVFDTFVDGTPTPSSGTLQWAGASTGARTVPATAGFVAASRNGRFRITAVRALSGTLSPTLGLSTVQVTILDNAPTGPVLQVGAGKPFTTIAAAVAAVQPGQTIEVYNGTYDEAFVTPHAGTQQQPITFKAAAGQTAVFMTGALTNAGKSGVVHLNHQWWIAGEGIQITGKSNGTTAQWTSQAALNPERGVLIRASNTQVKFKARNFKQEWFLCPDIGGATLTRVRVNGADCDISGTLDQGPPDNFDASDGWAEWLPNGPPQTLTFWLTEYSVFKRGGHACTGVTADDYLIHHCLYNNDWSATFPDNYSPGLTGYGQKCIDTNGNRGTMEDCVFLHPGQQVDAPSTQTSIDGTHILRQRRLFVLEGIGSVGCSGLEYNTLRGPGPSQIYLCHSTVWKMTGTGLGIDDSNAFVGLHGPWYIKNCIFAQCSLNPHFQKEGFPIYMEYRSTRGVPWTQKLFIDSCCFSSNQQIQIHDIDGKVGTVKGTLSQLMAAYPVNFKNCIVVDPDFVNAASPTSSDPVTALAQARANFLPRAAALLGTAVPLTQVTVGSNGGNTVTVSDGEWFRDNYGWSHLEGDDVYFQGVGTRKVTARNGNVLTLNSGISVGVGSGVYLGTTGTPNIGAVI
jgi:hypothetical protein